MFVARRSFLLGSAGAALSLAAGAGQALAAADRFAASPWRKITNPEWRKRLSPLSYQILARERHGAGRHEPAEQ